LEHAARADFATVRDIESFHGDDIFTKGTRPRRDSANKPKTRWTLNTSLYGEKSIGYFGNARTAIGPLLPERVSRVLEIGCGTGATCAWLRSVRSVDFCAGVELVAEAAAQAARVLNSVIAGNIETLELPFEPANFDLILALDVLEHLVDPWTTVRQLHRLLRPGGAIIASIPNLSHYSVALPLLVRGRWNYRADGLLDKTHLRFFVERTAVDLMSCSGLIVDMLERIRAIPSFATGRYTGRYFTRLLASSPFRHLVDFQFLIRATLPQRPLV
jgi:SAM-dependent methyltransferase